MQEEEEAITDLVHTVASQLLPIQHDPSEQGDIPRPGCKYKRYRKLPDIPETVRPFYEIVAKTAGISADTLVRGVFNAELKMDRWQSNKRRREVLGEDEATRQTSDQDEVMADAN